MQQKLRMLDEARKAVPEVDAAQAKAEFDDGRVAVLLDVREAYEWRRGHIPGAVRIPVDEVPEAADASSSEPDPNLIQNREGRIIVYCDKGVRSLLAAHEMKKLGYSDVASMAGGIKGWSASGYPVER
ncbi:MAG: rhodanese-like domain-containing protein [Actinomycetota bacterium]|nr:rhodanese-like domain-containing protein [Actinomycetota bacterium]